MNSTRQWAARAVSETTASSSSRAFASPLASSSRAQPIARPQRSFCSAAASSCPPTQPTARCVVRRRRASTPCVSRRYQSTSNLANLADAPPAGALPPFARRHPQLYGAIQEPTSASVAALAARIRMLDSSLSAQDRQRRIRLVRQACTHPSFKQLLARARDAQRKMPIEGGVSILSDEDVADNSQLEALGNSLLGLLGSEALHLKYPHLPTRVLKAALSAYVGANTTADVGGELGLAAPRILRWDSGEMEQPEGLRRHVQAPRSRKGKKGGPVAAELAPEQRSFAFGPSDARSSAVKALLGLIYQEQGLEAVKAIVQTRFLSRTVDLAGMLKFEDPKRVLSNTCLKYGRERPQSRLIAETGRLSNAPVFIVGVYSGTLKLGEGFGSSIKMAEFRAAEDALRRLYLAQAPMDPQNLPSATLQTPTVAAAVTDAATASPAVSSARLYSPPALGSSEVMYGSRG